MALLAAVASGDAALEDIAAELRREGIDSVSALLAMLREAVKNRRASEAAAKRIINLSHLTHKTPPDLVSDIVHQAPEVPFVLNGTLFDPKDINRFDGQELHFAVAVSRDHMLAIDDLDVIGRWWQYIYLSSLTTRSPLEDYQYGGYQVGVETGPLAGELAGPVVVVGRGQPPPPQTWFCEHVNFGGVSITLAKEPWVLRLA